ncbi:hypothetical protein [Zunongwangia endophytica]|uniref:VanZ like family protein n=1 Tax=Zunongwangia endophytica TaxID=1808945 RepID=A0ABV8HEA1_9FLAO|nr:hypothetical protein [Zunongwangia endophytica]MDN3594670.1 hypothetical protein [Zunongwangia endophytica]
MEFKNHLTRPFFLPAVFLLLLNDFVLKSHYHNAFTGKLSDIVGLFAFSYFLSIFVSRKFSICIIYWATALFFTFWKSNYSEEFIQFINQGSLQFGRVVDYTDLWALFILPLSYWYRTQKNQDIKKINNGFKYASLIVSCFAFLATSTLPTTINLKLQSSKSYRSNFPKETIIRKLQLTKQNDSLYTTFLDAERNNSSIYLKVIVKDSKHHQTQIRLDSILSFTHRDHSILSILNSSEKQINDMKSWTLKDYEKLFEQQKITLLKSQN